MKQEKIADDYSTVNRFINFILFIVKYAALIFCVVAVAVTMFLGIMLVMKGNKIQTGTLAEAISFVTSMKEADVTNYVQKLGVIKVTVAFIAYSASVAITMGLLRAVIGKFKEIFNLITSGNMFEETTVEMVNDCIPLSILFTFVQPVIMFFTVSAIGIFDYSDINVSGVTFIAISYIAKLLVEAGHDLHNKNLKLSKDISDIKAYESEIKITALKKQAEAKKAAPKPTAKKATPVKKVVSKPVAKAKTTSKKTTTK